MLDVAPADAFLFEVYTDLSSFDTALKTNDASVTLSGRAVFPYFNTVEKNTGSFTVSGGHQFTTATSYTNEGGTTTVQTGGDLFVQGALKVYGGWVDVDADSTITVQTQTESIGDEGATRDISVEVIGGELNIANPDFLPSTPMFTQRSDSAPGLNPIRLEAGQVWIVREQVAIDEATLEETVTPASINLGNAAIKRSNGTIIIDGASARFDAAERMQYNHGSLTLQNGFEFDTLVDDFRNAPEADMTLQAATFRVTGANGSFRNDGALVMDGDSYLFANQFINGTGASVQLDGVIDATQVTINAGSTITGAGSITGSILNNGTLDLGNSPGIIESFGGYTQGSSAELAIEILGYEAGEAFDQLIVRQLDAIEGEPAPPETDVQLDGALAIDFDLPFEQNFEWILIDHQGDSPITGGFEPGNIFTTGLVETDPTSETGLLNQPDDVYLGDLERFGIYLTYAGGDGNDLSVYTLSSVLGDANNDGQVDGNDLLTIEQEFGATGAPDGTLLGDANGDGQVDGNDLLVAEQAFGSVAVRGEVSNAITAASAAAVPEPTSAVLLGLGGLGLLRRSRRRAL